MVLRAAHANPSHFALAFGENACVFRIGCGGFLAVAAREARVDFIV
jgi:hypothetical protein